MDEDLQARSPSVPSSICREDRGFSQTDILKYYFLDARYEITKISLTFSRPTYSNLRRLGPFSHCISLGWKVGLGISVYDPLERGLSSLISHLASSSFDFADRLEGNVKLEQPS